MQLIQSDRVGNKRFEDFNCLQTPRLENNDRSPKVVIIIIFDIGKLL